MKYLKDHPTMPHWDKLYLEKHLEKIDEYERKGLIMGMLSGTVLFFFPAIRRLSIYKRLPLSIVMAFYWYNLGWNYGRDYVFVKTRNHVENWERDLGIRHFQTGL